MGRLSGGRLRGCIWLTAGLVVAVLAGAVGFITLQRAATVRSGEVTDEGPRVEVVVAVRSIDVRSQLSAEDLEVHEVPVSSAPEGAVPSVEDAIGKVTLVNLYVGEIILSQRLVDPNVISGDGRVALILSEDEVLMAFPAQDLMSQVNVLKPGDQVDILFSLDFPVDLGQELLPAAQESGSEEEQAAANPTATGRNDEEQTTFSLLQNVSIAAIVTEQTPTGGETRSAQAILLTVTPQDALLLKYAKDAGGVVDIVLRAPGVERPFATEPVDVDYMINRYRIPTEIGR